MELLGLGLELDEAALGVDEDGVFGLLAHIELLLEGLRRLVPGLASLPHVSQAVEDGTHPDDALLEPFETHLDGVLYLRSAI